MAPTKSIPPPKVQGRRTNNSLSSLTENIFIPLPIVSVKTDPPTPPDKPNRGSEKAGRGGGHNHRPPQSPVVAESASTGKSASSPSPSQSPHTKKKKGKSGDV